MSGEVKERRYKVLLVDPVMLVELLRADGSRVEVAKHGIPADAKVAGVGHRQWDYSPEYASIAVVLESAEFEPVPEGTMLPILRLLYRVKEGRQ